MGKVITFHSYRGGTGKTLSTLNLAALYANLGKNVCILDVDFKAPSIHIIFQKNTQYWLNDYLDDQCKAEQVIEDYTTEYDTKGKLLVSLANPNMDSIREYSTKGRNWQMDALRRFIELTKFLKEKQNMDYVLVDSSPGITYSSLNAIVASDLTVVVTTRDKSDINGSKMMIQEFHGIFEDKASVLVNKAVTSIPCKVQPEEINQYQTEMKQQLQNPIVGVIPCYCDISRTRANSIFVLENPKHPFTKELTKIAHRIEQLSKK